MKLTLLSRLIRTNILTMAAASVPALVSAAEISGYVLDYNTAEPVVDAQVTINGQSADVDTDGFYSIEAPQGQVDVTIAAPNYESASKSINAVDGQINNVSINLLSTSGVAAGSDDGGDDEYAEVEVVGRYVPPTAAANERDAAAILDSIGGAEMSRSGDSNVASALKRVVGLSVRDGKYVSIRGLDGRYIAARFNGALMPSTNPTKREVPLDIIPSGIIESVNVKKGFTADLPGDSTGGTVELLTKRYDSKPFTKVGVSLGYNPLVTGDTAYLREGGEYDFLGFDDGNRSLPGVISGLTNDGKQRIERQNDVTPNGFTQEQIDQMGKAFPVNYEPVGLVATPDLGVDYSSGAGYKSGDWLLGYTTGFKYANKWSTQQGGIERDLPAKDNFDFYRYKNQVSLLGMVSLGATYNHFNTFTSNTLLTRITDNEFKFKHGVAGDQSRPTHEYNSAWKERQVFLQQFLGEHQFSDLNMAEVNWGITASMASQLTPDTLRYQYAELKENEPLAFFDAKFDRDYGELQDFNLGFDTDFKWPFYKGEESTWDVHTGLSLYNKQRETTLQSYSLGSNNTSQIQDILKQPNANDVLDRDNVNEDVFQIKNNTQASEQYEGTIDTQAVFLASTFDWKDSWNVNLGARLEKSALKVDTFQGSFNAPLSIKVDNTDLLPSVNVAYNVLDDLKLRFGYSNTVSRPELRELAPSPYIDDDYGFEIIGNLSLQQSNITNLDFRTEWYLNDQDNISVALFHKDIQNPIERVPISAVGNATVFTFINNNSAYVQGLELDFRKSFEIDLGYIHNVFVSGNYAMIESEVDVRGASNVAEREGTKRPLQGQPESLLNLQLGWDDILRQQKLTMSYNLTGKTLFSAYGVTGSEYIVPTTGSLGITYEKKFGDNLSMNFKADNVLDAPTVHKVEGFGPTRVVRKFKTGQNFSVGLGYRW